MPDTGPTAPARTLVAVRAIVPVAQMPPNRRRGDVGDALARPARSSSGAAARSCRRPPPPRAATRCRRAARRRRRPAARPATLLERRSAAVREPGSERGMPPKRVPMVSTGSCEQPQSRRPRRRPRSGSPARSAGSGARPRMMPIVTAATPTAAGLTVPAACQSAASFGMKAAGSLPGKRQAEQVAQLAGEDDDGDAGREADRDRIGDVLDVGAEPQEADRHQDEPRHHGREQPSRRSRAARPSPRRAR